MTHFYSWKESPKKYHISPAITFILGKITQKTPHFSSYNFHSWKNVPFSSTFFQERHQLVSSIPNKGFTQYRRQLAIERQSAVDLIQKYL